MNRRDFLRLLGAAPVAAATMSLAGKAVAALAEPVWPVGYVTSIKHLVQRDMEFLSDVHVWHAQVFTHQGHGVFVGDRYVEYVYAVTDAMKVAAHSLDELMDDVEQRAIAGINAKLLEVYGTMPEPMPAAMLEAISGRKPLDIIS